MAKVLSRKQEMFHASCVDESERDGLVEVSVESLEDDDVCGECGEPLNQDPQPTQEDVEAAEGTGTTHSDVQSP